MIVAAILAGGIGRRMENVEKPKQYLKLNGQPILIHTLRQFCHCKALDKVLVLCPKDWIGYTKELMNQYLDNQSAPLVLEGGTTRNETIMNAINFIEAQYGLSHETILLTHDAVRPFVTERIIRDNISATIKTGCCNTVIPATDTIIESADGIHITKVPERSKLYHSQTPQSFRAAEFQTLYNSLTQNEKENLTDAAGIFVLKRKKVAFVTGEAYNIKVTYPFDLRVVEAILKEKRHGE